MGSEMSQTEKNDRIHLRNQSMVSKPSCRWQQLVNINPFLLFVLAGFRVDLHPPDSCLLLCFGAAVGEVVLQKESLQDLV